MIFITDMYHPDSVESTEKPKRRSADKPIIINVKIKKSKNLKAFLSYNESKQQLIKPILSVSQMNLTTEGQCNLPKVDIL